jgi:glycosyltransferase involved in cell wall biosynthesis
MAQGQRRRLQTISPGVAPQAPEKLPTVSVVLPVRNAERDIEACLEAVLGQDYPPHLLELIVVDGNSQDGTRGRVAAYAQRDTRIKLLSNPAGTIPAGLNIGIQAASGEIVARVDVRTSLATDYLKTAVELLASTGADNVGGPVRGVSPTIRGRALILARESRFGLAGAAARYGETTEHWTDTVYLGVYPRRVFATIGLYDEEVTQDEDAELNYRLRAQGGRILVSPRLRTTYFYPSSLRRFLWKNLLFGVSKVRVWQKNPRMLSWRHFIPPAFVAFLVLGPLLGRIHWLFEALWALSAGAYLVTCLGVAAWYLLRGRGRVALLLPLVFPLLHLGWGAGFLAGLVRYGGRWFQHWQAPSTLSSKSVLPRR